MADANEPIEGASTSNDESGAAVEDSLPTSIPSPRSESIKAANISDQASDADSLGFRPYVEAIAEFLTNDETQPPLTLSIEGGWGSGKSSFMKQLQTEIEQIEERNQRPKPKMVWFNAWRHDKVEALWAAFALEFLQQISKPQTRADVIPTWRGHLKLLWRRFKWRENWQDAIRLTFLSLFLLSLVGIIPALLWRVGWQGVNQLSNQIVCRLSPEENSEGEHSNSQANSSNALAPSTSPTPPLAPTPSPSPTPTTTPGAANPLDACLASDFSSGNLSEKVLNILLTLAGFAGSTTGIVALLLKLGELIGDPKNDLKQYLESPDYENQVAFIEKFHEDFEKIVSAYAGKGNKVYVFIDDLDRCELTKAADLMQGLNLLIANDPHLIFLLGMDREKVAAGIALKQKAMLPYLPSAAVVLDTATQESRAASKGLEYGYAFIEKFIQLPFQVPRASEEQFRYFLETMSPQKPSSISECLYRLYLYQISKLENTKESSSQSENQEAADNKAQALEGVPQELCDFIIGQDNEKKPILLLLIFWENGVELFCLLSLYCLLANDKLPGFGGRLREIQSAVLESIIIYLMNLLLACGERVFYSLQYTSFLRNSYAHKIKFLYLNLLAVFDKKNGIKGLIRYSDKPKPFKPIFHAPQSTRRANLESTESTPTQSGQITRNRSHSRREMMKFEVTRDSRAVHDIVLMAAPALDYNPRRIKQFINLFRLRVFIASNTGLFDEVDGEGSEPLPPLTLEQLGKFTALCLKYPLLRVDLEKDDTLLAKLHKYACRDQPYRTDGSKLSNRLADRSSSVSLNDATVDATTKHWGNQPAVVQLLRAGVQDRATTSYAHRPETYSLEKVNVQQLLQISPRVTPLDRVPLRSERGVDYSRLRNLLRAKQWREADAETWQVMLKAAQRKEQDYLDISDIAQFPCLDMQTIDQLWVTASGGKFGFSVQRKIYAETGNPLDGEYHEGTFKGFGDRIGWRVNNRWLYYSELSLSTDAPSGHLPARFRSFRSFLGAREPVFLLISLLFSRAQTCKA